MTAKEIQKRNAKAESLRVLQSEDGQFFVESAKGKVLYNVALDDERNTCTCGDWATNIKKDSNFRCKHILAVMNAIPKKEVEGAQFCERPVPRLDDRFMTNIKGKDFVLYAGVLDLATQNGLLKLEVELLQYPSKENGNEAICRAVAEGKSGHVFSDIGDANPNNCASMIAKHLIRMASTRAKGRCLRDMCNIGIACLEELADFDDVIGSGKPKKVSPRKTAGKTGTTVTPMKTAAKKKAPQTKKTEAASNKTNGNKKQPPTWVPEDPPEDRTTTVPEPGANKTEPARMSEAQKRAIANLSRRRGISVEEVENMATETYGMGLENLTSTDASSFIRTLQQAA
jgi:predicted nucleic acid-binding Zn finger protein